MLALILSLVVKSICAHGKPNIVFIIADDLGYYDTGLTNPVSITPTINELAREGVLLNQSYVQPLCTPSRTAILSGFYPFHVGRQGRPLLGATPTCLDTSLKLLPEELQGLGYKTHAIGKWHLGFCEEACLPTNRGFDTFYGKYLGSGDHFTHEFINNDIGGVDFHVNHLPANSSWGKHSTDVFCDEAVDIIHNSDLDDPFFVWLALQTIHTPLQVPSKYLALYPDITDTERRTALAMTSHMDDGIKRVVDAIKEKGIEDNTLLVWLSDNGGTNSGGYSYPLRGGKGTAWEGGTRSLTLLWGGVLSHTAPINDGLFHATDWYSSLIGLAGGDTEVLNVDGIDNSDMLITGGPSKRNEMVYELNNETSPFLGAIRYRQFQFLIGNAGSGDWSIPPEIDYPYVFGDADFGVIHKLSDNRVYQYPEEWERYLFDIQNDPEERVNLIYEYPEIAEMLEYRVAELEKGLVPADLPAQTPDAADPDKFGGFWSTGWC